MSAHGERTLMLHLLDVESLEVLAREGLPEDMIPTEAFRPIVRWSVDYWHQSGRSKAPSIAAIRAEPEWSNALDDHEVRLGDDEPEDSIEWAIDDLKSSYAHLVAQQLLKRAAQSLAEAEQGDIPSVVDEYAGEFVSLSMSLTPRAQQTDAREETADRVLAYERREETRSEFFGMRLGLDAVDSHTFGIHEGELGVLGAGPKVGKSFLAAHAAISEWRSGRVAALFSLENSVQMTLDRIVCMMSGVDYAAWQRGTCDAEQVERVRTAVEELENSSNPLFILSPELGKRSVEQMVRQAQILEAQSIILDQLTFVELSGDPRMPRYERVGITMHVLKGMISTYRDPLSAFLIHQMSRDGVRFAKKNGHHQMLDFADASEVERTVDWAWALYRSTEHRTFNRALLQTLASRRADIKWWELRWKPQVGNIFVEREVEVVEQ